MWECFTYFIFVLLHTLSHTAELTHSSSCSFSGHGTSLAAIPDIDEEAYISLGDINIGGFIMATDSGANTPCTRTYRKGSTSIETAEAIAYGVKLVNENSKLLPNVSLGFVLFNDCSNILAAVARALQFLPRVSYSINSPSSSICDFVTENRTSRVQSSHHAMQHYDVIGVISPLRSSTAVAVSQLLSTSKIPQIGSIATSDDLTDKTQHPFFLSLTAPDKFQVEGILAFIHSKGWTYVSVLYAYGVYGEKAYERIRQLSPGYGICIATYHKVNDKSDFDYIVSDLLRFQTARVVILFIYVDEVRILLSAVNRRNARGTFIWIGGGGLGYSFRGDFKGFEQDFLGTFVFTYYSTLLPDLFEHIRSLKPNATINPWLKPVWENLMGCSFSQGDCDPDSSILEAADFTISKTSSQYLDAVMVYAHATTKLMSDKCPGVSGVEARTCIKGDDLLKYMKNVSFNGYSGHIEFDDNGDAKGKYEIIQIGMGYKNIRTSNVSSMYGLEPKSIALYNISTKEIHYTGNNITWDHLGTVPRLTEFPVRSAGIRSIPESICSRPCLTGEYIIPKDLDCCWECRKCRDNERLIAGNTMCEECLSFTWPDPATNFTTCVDIALELPSVSAPVPLILISLAFIATVCTVIVSVSYVHFWDSRVIKASSKELSLFQIVAAVVGYITVILVQLPPTQSICKVRYFMFCFSFSCLYSALLVKTVRVYRIFLNSSKFHRNPALVGWRSQIVMTFILVTGQVILCVVTLIVAKPTVMKSQPVPTEKYVELTCNMTLPGFISFLVYNLVLVFLCSIFAFKTRKLPDNFNESWFIFMCVATTLIIWITFVPAYFTSTREFFKTLSLSADLLLNHTVALVFLLIPKLYAVTRGDSEAKGKMRFVISGNRIASLSNQTEQHSSGYKTNDGQNSSTEA